MRILFILFMLYNYVLAGSFDSYGMKLGFSTNDFEIDGNNYNFNTLDIFAVEEMFSTPVSLKSTSPLKEGLVLGFYNRNINFLNDTYYVSSFSYLGWRLAYSFSPDIELFSSLKWVHMDLYTHERNTYNGIAYDIGINYCIFNRLAIFATYKNNYFESINEVDSIGFGIEFIL